MFTAAISQSEVCVAGTSRIAHSDITALSLGCAVYGVGGGGNAEVGGWAARHAIDAAGGFVPLVSLDELPDDGLILPLSAIGAPTVSQEMIPSGAEPHLIRETIERVYERSVVAIMPEEIGGANGVRSAGWAASLGLPLLDADGMGRAFPEIDMVTMELAGIAPGTLVLADILGNVTTLRPRDGGWAERMARASAVASGSSAIMGSYVLTTDEARGAVIEGTVSAALAAGRVVADPRQGMDDLCAHLGARRIITGKIIDLEQRSAGGFVRGSAVIAGLGADRDRLARMEIQNENLIVTEDGRCLASTPDLIVACDAESGRALGTESLQFGQRVVVIAWACDPLWRSPRGIARSGPRAFGYDIDYTPIEDLD